MTKSLSDFRPQRRNANKHKPLGMKHLADGIREHGIADGITVAADGESISGAARIETLAEIMPDVKIVEVETDGNTLLVNRRMDIPNADDPRAQQLSAAVNIVARNNYNPDGALLAALAADDETLKRMIAADEMSMQAVMAAAQDEPGDAEPQISRADELLEKWQVKRGDLWRISDHLLLCGDSTVREDVARVMGGERAEMTFTSPPYNAGDSEKLSGNTHSTDTKYIGESKDNLNQKQYSGLLSAFTLEALVVSDFVFVNIQPLAGNKIALIEYWHDFVGSFADVAIWDKTNAAPEQARRVMDSRFEFILIFSKGATRAIGTRDFRGMVHNVFTSQPQRNNDYSFTHAATFPTELPTHFIRTFTNDGEIIYDPFLGSGTTLIACQNLNRHGRGIEISPGYVAVTLQRMATAFPGIEIERIP